MCLRKKAHLRGPAAVAAGLSRPPGALLPSAPRRPAAGAASDYDTAFDLVACNTHEAGWAMCQRARSMSKYHNDHGGKQGWCLAASGPWNRSQDHVVLLAAGVGRYMLNSSTQSVIDTAQGIRLWRGGGVHFGCGHRRSDAWRTTVAYARTQFARDEVANTTPGANSRSGADFYPNQRLTQRFLTTWWSPLATVDAGMGGTTAAASRSTANVAR